MYGDLVRSARLAQGLTQATLAEVSGIDQPNISAIETGRRQPSMETFHRLLDACGFVLEARAGDAVLSIAPPPGDEGFDAARPSLGHEPVRPPHRTTSERARLLVAALDAAEAIVRAR